MTVNNTSALIINPAFNGTVIQNTIPNELGSQESTIISSLATRTQIISPNNEFPDDLVGEIYWQCFSNNDITSIQALAYTNKRFYKYIAAIVEKIDLQKLCPLLKIVSAEEAQKYGFNAVPAPYFPKLSLIKGYQEMAPNVEGDAGVTYFDFTLPEDLTLNQIVEVAKDQGIGVEFWWSEILPAIGDVAIKQAFPCMLTNSVFKDSRNENYDAQCVRVRKHGCELPTVDQYITHIVLTSKISGQCLFKQKPLMTYGRSSTLVKDFSLVVGGSSPEDSFGPGRIRVDFRNGFDYEADGAGGCRKF